MWPPDWEPLQVPPASTAPKQVFPNSSRTDPSPPATDPSPRSPEGMPLGTDSTQPRADLTLRPLPLTGQLWSSQDSRGRLTQRFPPLSPVPAGGSAQGPSHLGLLHRGGVLVTHGADIQA